MIARSDDRLEVSAALGVPAARGLTSCGESWHNNHHGVEAALDPDGRVVTTVLEKLGLAWKVKRIPRERQASTSPFV